MRPLRAIAGDLLLVVMMMVEELEVELEEKGY